MVSAGRKKGKPFLEKEPLLSPGIQGMGSDGERTLGRRLPMSGCLLAAATT